MSFKNQELLFKKKPYNLVHNGWGRNYFSISSLNYYQSCNKAYYLKYIERIPEKSKPDYLLFGGAIHVGLKVWAETKDYDAAVAAFTKEFKYTAKRANLLDIDRYLTEGRTILNLWSKKGYSFKPKLLEETYLVPVVNPRTGEELPLPLMVQMDVIDERGIIADYKIVKSKLDEIEGFQKVAYWIAYEHIFGKPPKQFMICPIIKGKTMPKVQKPLVEVVTENDKINFFNFAKETLEAIELKSFKSTHSTYRPCGYAPLICRQ